MRGNKRVQIQRLFCLVSLAHALSQQASRTRTQSAGGGRLDDRIILPARHRANDRPPSAAQQINRMRSRASFLFIGAIVGALVAGGLAGIVGGWAFGQWMEKAHFFPLIAGLVGSASPSVGKSLYFLFAVIIGATFGLLFQRDVRGYGSSAGWGLAYGIFWWFLGPLTIKSLLQAQKPDWSLAHGQELFGSLIGHIVYGLIVGIIYAALDKLWVGFFIDSDPINRQPEGPGSRTLLSLGRGMVAGLVGGLVFWPQIVAVDGLPWIARLAGGTSP